MSDAPKDDAQTRTYAVRLTERSQRDIDHATVHFAETASSEIAVAWREGLYDVLAKLANFPRRHPVSPERFRKEVRQFVYRRPGGQAAYRILFTLSGEDLKSIDPPTVTILHVRHSSARKMTRSQVRAIETE